VKLRIGIAVVLAGALGALAVPAASANYVYWPNIGGTSIGRMALDGSQLNNNFLPTQNASTGDELNAVAVDSHYIYWAHGNSSTGAIGRAKLDGTDVQPSFIPHSAGVDDAFGVAVTATHLYWISDNGAAIGRADISGANPNPDFVTLPPSPCGLAADNNFLYFSAGSAAVGRVPIGGGTPENDFIPVPNGKDCGVAVDGSHVYWADNAPVGSESYVGRANLDGSQVDHSFISGTGIHAFGIAVTPQYVFWGSGFTTGSVGRANLDGSGPNDAFAVPGSETSSSPFLLAASPSNAFTVGKAKLNKKNGTAKITATVQGPGVLLVDAASRGAQAVVSKKKGSTVRQVKVTAKAAGTYTLKVRAKGKAVKALKTNRKAKLKVGITFTPQGVAGIPSLQARKLVLKRR
jgi:hypothetical protein